MPLFVPFLAGLSSQATTKVVECEEHKIGFLEFASVTMVVAAPALEQSDDHAEVLEGLGSEGRFRPCTILSDEFFALVRG